MQKNIYEKDRIKLLDNLPLELPLCVSIEPANICNFHCTFCFHGNNEQDERAKPLKIMDDDCFQKVLNDLVVWTGGYRKIKLIKLYSLGEPLLNPHIAEWVRAIKEADVCNGIEITTNASYLSHEMAEDLIDAGLDILRVSVYGATEELFSRTTGKPASTEQDVVDNVAYLVNLRNSGGIRYPKVYAKMMDTSEEENRRFFEKWESVADECGLDELFDLTSGDSNIFQNMYGSGAEQAFEKSMSSNLYRNRKICRYPFTHLTVRSDGTVVVCCADWLKETAYGNVMEHSLKDIWNSKSLYEFRKEMVEQFGACHTCCQRCEIPLRDTPEDDLMGLTMERFNFTADI